MLGVNMADFQRLGGPGETVIHEGNLKKKVGKKSWKDFCAVVKGDMVMFSNPSDGKWAGNIELDEGSTCTLFVKGSRIGRGIEDTTTSTEIAELNKRKKIGGTLKFTLQTKRGVHLLKADSETICLEWIRVVRKAVFKIRAENTSLSPRSTGKTLRTALTEGNNNKVCKNSFTYEAIEAEDSESEVQSDPRKLSRSKSLRETRDSAMTFFKRSRFRSFRKPSKNYNNLKES
jgi:hypothetical protein